jgi:hypothetical protein
MPLKLFWAEFLGPAGAWPIAARQNHLMCTYMERQVLSATKIPGIVLPSQNLGCPVLAFQVRLPQAPEREVGIRGLTTTKLQQTPRAKNSPS